MFEKEDIHRIGHTIYEENGNAVFLCNLYTANIEAIVLRNVLKLWGDYEITSEEDWFGAEDMITDIKITTNIPARLVING